MSDRSDSKRTQRERTRSEILRSMFLDTKVKEATSVFTTLKGLFGIESARVRLVLYTQDPDPKKTSVFNLASDSSLTELPMQLNTSDNDDVIQIVLGHVPGHFFLLEEHDTDSGRPKRFAKGAYYYTGTVVLEPHPTLTRFDIVDYGQFPWGRGNFAADASDELLAAICKKLDIHTRSGVANCCAITHIIAAFFRTKVLSKDDILHKLSLVPPEPMSKKRKIT